ncbi:unnamed protein product [Rotaria sp. Silwood1]|nr:unnamed protein product [Rotaria sp. Silwood1]
MDVWLIFVVIIIKTVAEQLESELANDGNHFQVKSTKVNIESEQNNNHDINGAVKEQKVVCVEPYVLTSSETCVNVLIDRNNCGTVSHKCNASYKSCSRGECSMAPAVQLKEPIIIWQGAINGSADDQYFSVILPLNITLYNTTTNNVSLTTNGVSLLS